MPSIEARLKTLGSYLVERPPVFFGTLPVSPDKCELFYGKQGAVRRLNLATASQDELKVLSDSCDKATFGLAQEDVHDESYRKAGKLDNADFAMHFNVVEAGLLEVISDELFEGKKKKAPICAELYKLNVYGEGSFFKPHLDTPRGKTMFGSLVITFPTKHEGGVLTFRHEGKEWSVDSGKLCAEKEELSAVYAAFYSDVEHEVLPVRKGYRVTVTYNLYFESPKQVGNRIHADGSALRAAFADLIEDTTFMSNGGCLGFGLRHQYPLNKSQYIARDHERRWGRPEVKYVPGPELRALEQYLKGGDALLKQVCDELKLKTSLGIVYRDPNEQVEVLCPQVVDLDDPEPRTLEGEDCIHDSLIHWLCYWYGGKVLPNRDGWDSEMEVEWVTDSPKVNAVRQKYMAYGNEPQKAYTYFRICLFVTVGPEGLRETLDD
ncbi:hypothetical protein DAEQUDRAFT_765397 [Daedalea quercina L-15889]|uniref:Fe2OG dioxygenase domain-containing protein n=1 Tax=Daedalea quercina L-15889 TaxID=1314783 RepID=A0A165QJI8_9APHY|nr:hypothetical protein DAEQUDRAFT_765397 [Daedalea quercina L-15889]